MAKKGKVGKQRKDNYYRLAKQKGYKSRAAFKLIQLNRKFQFLENSRVCVDLCAAPGGWLQVASEYMPVSSVIVGVDLVPIDPIKNVISFQCDITTDECSEKIESTLAGWKADVVLHDGAPNVGRNWLQDAYGQNVLVVNALKIACKHLVKGGWFITKIFRSADYNSLIWVLGKLFGRVHATKPQASRSESAEIFVVCQNYRKPADIDPRFFDPSAIFADISNFDDALKKQKADLLKPAAKIKKTKAHGYEGIEVLKKIPDIQFVTSNNHMDYLAQCHEITLTSNDILNHHATSEEIKECCKDLKILGRKELLRLLKWRREVRKDLVTKLMQDGSGESVATSDIGTADFDQLTIPDSDEEDYQEPELSLDDIEAIQDETKRKEARRLKKKEEKRQRDYQQRVNYGMINQGDILIEEEHDLFSLNTIDGKKRLEQIDNVEPEETVEEHQDPDDLAKQASKDRRTVTFSRETDVQYFDKDQDYDEDDDPHPADDPEPVKEDEEKIKAPKNILKKGHANDVLSRLNTTSKAGGGLLTDLMDINEAKIASANRFFDGETFHDIDLEKEFETDLVDTIADARSVSPIPSLTNVSTEVNMDDGDEDSDVPYHDAHELPAENDSSDSDSSEDEEDKRRKRKQIRLDPEGLAIGTMMYSSSKNRKMIEDEGWNRYTHGDTHLAPRWFREEEEKHCRRNIPVTPELVREYKQKLREIDAKPIKKVMQAKSRQKRRALRKMEKVKKKVEGITSNEDITQRERVNLIKSVYRNATKTKKKEVKLVVGRKGLPTKRPGGGKYKMVDSRLKKDLRAKERRDNKGKKGKKPKKSGNFNRKRKDNNSFKSSKKGPQKHKSKKGGKSKKK